MAANRNKRAGILFLIFVYFCCMSKTCDDNRVTRIYSLSDPGTGEVRYIGKTVQTIEYRLTQHIWDSLNRNGKTHKWNWIKWVLKQGRTPMIEELECCRWIDSAFMEMYWISQMKAWGFNLVNETDGGEGNSGHKASTETILKMKETLRKKAKPVYQYSLSGEFIKKWSNAKTASKDMGILYTTIVSCCRKHKKSAGGFIWRYRYSESVAPWKPNKNSKPKSPHPNNFMYASRKRVLVVSKDTGRKRVFSSIRNASKSTGISTAGICCECKGKRKTRGNFIFQYYGKNT